MDNLFRRVSNFYGALAATIILTSAVIACSPAANGDPDYTKKQVQVIGYENGVTCYVYSGDISCVKVN